VVVESPVAVRVLFILPRTKRIDSVRKSAMAFGCSQRSLVDQCSPLPLPRLPCVSGRQWLWVREGLGILNHNVESNVSVYVEIQDLGWRNRSSNESRGRDIAVQMPACTCRYIYQNEKAPPAGGKRGPGSPIPGLGRDRVQVKAVSSTSARNPVAAMR
jgi:hypothetical protein